MRPGNVAFWLGAVFLVAAYLVCCCSGGGGGGGGSSSAGRESYLRVGKGINLFMRYGYMGISMRVIPHNDSTDSERWLFKEPTKNIYKNISELTESRSEDVPGIFHGDFHIEFCDNRRQLMQAYFRDFTIEQLEKPWAVFNAGWFPEIAAKKLGIDYGYFLLDYAFVLLRVVRFREIGKLRTDIPATQVLEHDVHERAQQLQVGDVTGTIKFMEAFGTHYISSYTTGNSLFQVFVYNRKNYEVVKESIKSKGVSRLSKEELHNYFSPWFARELGQVRSASANATVERWARRKLQHYIPRDVVKFVTLWKLHGNATLLRSLGDLLGNEAILQLDLKSLNIIFRNEEPEKRSWFNEVLDNQLKLWEVNMPQN